MRGPWEGGNTEDAKPSPRPGRVWAVWPHAQVCTGDQGSTGCLVALSVLSPGLPSCPGQGGCHDTVQLSSAPPDSPARPPPGMRSGYQEEEWRQDRTSLLAVAEAPAATRCSRCLPSQLQIPHLRPTCGLCSHGWTPSSRPLLKRGSLTGGSPIPLTHWGPAAHAGPDRGHRTVSVMTKGAHGIARL